MALLHYIVGAGGRGLEMSDVLGTPNVSYVDDSRPLGQNEHKGFRFNVVSRVNEFGEYLESLDAGVKVSGDTICVWVCIGHPPDKESVLARLYANTRAELLHYYTPPFYRHYSAVVSKDATVGRGTLVTYQAVVASFARVGHFVDINYGAIVGHDAIVGDYCVLSPGAKIMGNVLLGDRVFLGANCTVVPGVKIGEGAIVQSGATVFHDVPPGCIAYGYRASIRNPGEKV